MPNRRKQSFSDHRERLIKKGEITRIEKKELKHVKKAQD